MPDIKTAASPKVSPLMLADRLLSLAQDADRAGYSNSASLLVGLAHSVFDETPLSPKH